ncbi:maleylacetoacetate isomerase [Pendulispora rubella]|uniref:Maleylacetoacetate isomerase n=1 Tax=Pendulispora rubella TaxID=2741070 RepID=A0ABZ2LLA7_9BACT
MPTLRLYTYWRSSSSYRVRFALELKKLAYESVAVNLREGEQHGEEHRERSPTGYVPCLFIDGRPVVESVAIIELLDELFPHPPLYPREPWARARVRSLVEVINAGTQPLQNLAVLDRLGSDAKVRTEWAKHFNTRGLASVERLMTLHEKEGVEGRFAYGDTLTAADLFLVPQMYSAQRFGVDLSAFPRAVAAAEAALSSEAAQAAMPERQPDARP